MNIPSSEKKHFQQLVLERYSANKRDLPWRQTHDPYKILVSEVMLQQTQVPRVIQKFTRWMELWPTVQDLAQASRADVLREWSGLGFNRRAINLHEACKQIANDSNSRSYKKNMSDYEYLRSLPGVGDYTANAILAFGYNMEVPVMDINIKRVLLHSFQLPPETPMWELQELALSVVPHGLSRDWHNALMDYGSQVLHSKATGIRSAKQSTFKGSDREVRGWILKELTSNHSRLLVSEVVIAWPNKDTEAIIQGLITDGFIVATGRGKSKFLQVSNGL